MHFQKQKLRGKMHTLLSAYVGMSSPRKKENEKLLAASPPPPPLLLRPQVHFQLSKYWPTTIKHVFTSPTTIFSHAYLYYFLCPRRATMDSEKQSPSGIILTSGENMPFLFFS